MLNSGILISKSFSKLISISLKFIEFISFCEFKQLHQFYIDIENSNITDKAIEYLKMAEKLNEKDYIILGNLAQTYKRKGDKENAIKYFELYKKYGDNQAKEDATKELIELKK